MTITGIDVSTRLESQDPYADAIEKIHTLQAREQDLAGLNPAARTVLLTHGQKAKKAVLWLHGYTDAPPQFKPLAELCYAKGYNALVPRVPHHGMQDRLSEEVSRLKTDELAHFADQMVDLMHGLGEEVIVAGLSMGGALAAWIAQRRPDVARVVIIAPFLGARIIPTRLTRVVSWVVQRLPDVKMWWDPELKENAPGPRYGYPHYSTRSLGQILNLAFRVSDAARTTPPAAGQVWMVLNEHDESVNNRIAEQLVARWRAAGAKNVETFTFENALGLPHDLIGIEQPAANPDLVYPELMRMVG